jgi:hypothetical protein
MFVFWMKGLIEGRSNTLATPTACAPESVAAEIRLYGAAPIDSFGAGEQK